VKHIRQDIRPLLSESTDATVQQIIKWEQRGHVVARNSFNCIFKALSRIGFKLTLQSTSPGLKGKRTSIAQQGEAAESERQRAGGNFSL
jgi:hypothetical protein